MRTLIWAGYLKNQIYWFSIGFFYKLLILTSRKFDCSSLPQISLNHIFLGPPHTLDGLWFLRTIINVLLYSGTASFSTFTSIGHYVTLRHTGINPLPLQCSSTSIKHLSLKNLDFIIVNSAGCRPSFSNLKTKRWKERVSLVSKL